MAKLYELETFSSDKGSLTVFEKIISGTIQRIFYIYQAGQNPRAVHWHHRTWNALICLNGSCRVYSDKGREEETFRLTSPRQSDYIYEPYPRRRRASALRSDVSRSDVSVLVESK